METKANYILIGAAAIFGAACIMVFALWLANSEFQRGYDEYDIVFSDPVRGLAEGGEVRFNGIKVGEVQTLRIDPDNTNRVIARVRVSTEVPLRTNSEAQLEPVGLTGVTLIQLSAGSPPAELIRQPSFGAPPRIVGQGSQIDLIVARGEDIAMRASEAMAAVRDLLTDENIARVTQIISNLDTISAQLADQNSVITQSGEAAHSIAQLAEQTRHDLEGLDRAVAAIESAGGQVSGQTLPEVTRAAEELRRASDSVADLASSLQENPLLASPSSRPTVELAP
jgi:phospholipid/cholesterol/gamma-HCH transport system substrate-binding protein